MAWLPRDTDLRSRRNWIVLAKHALQFRSWFYARRLAKGSPVSPASKKITALWVIRAQPYFDLEEDD